MERLQEWRSTDYESYQSAYVSLCLPKIFSPLIRLQMLFWSPFSTNIHVSEFQWYSTLATYAISQDETYSKFEADADRNLLSSCCEKVLIPKLVNIVQTTFDTVSASQTYKLIDCLTKLIGDFPTLNAKSKQLRELLSVVVDLIKESLDNDVYIPIYSKHQMETPNTPHSLFFNRQFWSAFKLFKNVLSWAGILSDEILMELVLDRLLNRYLLLSLRANTDPLDSIDKARQITALLPDRWMNPGTHEHSKLGMLCKFVGGAGSVTGLAREGVIEAAKLVKKLGDSETSDKLRELLY